MNLVLSCGQNEAVNRPTILPSNTKLCEYFYTNYKSRCAVTVAGCMTSSLKRVRSSGNGSICGSDYSPDVEKPRGGGWRVL